MIDPQRALRAVMQFLSALFTNGHAFPTGNAAGREELDLWFDA
jgi:hypothetical protein